MVPIGTMYGVNPSHNSTPVPSLTKGGSRILLSKIDGNGGVWKFLLEKGGGRRGNVK